MPKICAVKLMVLNEYTSQCHTDMIILIFMCNMDKRIFKYEQNRNSEGQRHGVLNEQSWKKVQSFKFPDYFNFKAYMGIEKRCFKICFILPFLLHLLPHI